MSGTYRLTVQPGEKTVVVEQGESVLKALQRLDLPVRSDCGGSGVCGKCRVLSHDANGLSPVSDKERAILGEEQLDEGYRLACLASVNGETSVVVAQPASESGSPRGKKIQAPACIPDPAVRRIFIDADKLCAVEASDVVIGQLLSEQLFEWSDFSVEKASTQFFRLLGTCPVQERQDGVTVIVHEQQGVLGVLAGNKMKVSLGLAVDLGTTTIAAYLCDLQRGKLLSSAAMFNPQRKYGDDVISRISSAAENDTSLSEMQGVVAAALLQLARQCLTSCGYTDGDLDELVVVGNTTMQTILAGDSPESLGRAPYLPKTFAAQNIPAEKLGLHLGASTNVYIFPVISGFLGGDSVAAALGGELQHHPEPTLIIDIGTNGELLLGCGERIIATSCATGPALEGAAISCGMRAVPGAIDKVEVAPGSKSLLFHHLGSDEGVLPLGICGSGLIDAIACLRQIGVLLESGRLNENAPGVVCDEGGIGRAYVLVPAEKSGSGKDITLTLQDVRSFQLAKSALVVGTEKLLERYGLEEAPHTCITGAFGAHFNWRNGLAVDLLSTRVTRSRVSSGANLAGAGAMMALIDRKKRREAEQLALKCTAFELAADPDFNQRFVERTKFPALKN